MKKAIYTPLFSIVFLLLAFVPTAKASSIFGSHIGYKAIDSTTYEVILTIYRDCNSIPLNTPQIHVEGKTDGVYTSFATKVSTTDITGSYLNCTFNSRCNGSYVYGFEKIIYKDTVDVSGGACEYKFSYSECCRNSAITTGGGGTQHYNYALINKCAGLNNSVQADLDPRLLIPYFQDATISTFIGDSIDLNDSVRYELVNSMKDSVTAITYSGQWSLARPVTFLGFPINNLGTPAGFHFEEFSGDIQFRPTIANEVATFCVAAKEYRNINGVMAEIGRTRLEFTTIIVNEANNSPRVLGASAIACSNQQVCLDFEARDNNNNDTTTLQVLGLPKGATVTYGYNGSIGTAQVCWTPTQNDVRNDPYQFVVFVNDNSCKIGGRNSRKYGITVRQSPDTNALEITSKTPQCSSAEIKLTVKKSLPGLSFYSFDEDSIYYSQLLQPRLYFKGSGWKKFYVTAKTSSSCSHTLTDSVFITPQYGVQLSTKNDTTICTKDSVIFFTNALSGKAPYTYNWNILGMNKPLPHTNSFADFVNKDSKYTTLVADSNQCIGIDTVSITASPTPYIDAGKNDSVCYQTPFNLVALPYSGVQVAKYNWIGIDTLQTVSTQTDSSKWYYVTATGASGCTHTDSVYKTVLPKVSFQIIKNLNLCVGSSKTVEITNPMGVAPFVYKWDGVVKTNKENIVVQQSKNILIEVSDKNQCKAKDTLKITANANPNVQLGNDKTVCIGSSQLVQANIIGGKQPFAYQWSNGKTTNTITPVINNAQQFLLQITDDNGCIGSDVIKYDVYPKEATLVTQKQVVCESQTPIALIANPNTGMWAGTGVVNNLFVPSLAGVGVHKVEYSFMTTNSCTEKSEVYFVVKQLPLPDFTVDKTQGLPNTTFNFTNQTSADTAYTIVWDMGELGKPGNIITTPNASYTYTNKGKYTVKLTVYNGVCDPQTIVKKDLISIDSVLTSTTSIAATGLKLYPNPANNIFTIEANQTIAHIAMYTITGSEIKLPQVQSTKNTNINVSAFASGIYLVKITFDNGAYLFQKIIINQ